MKEIHLHKDLITSIQQDYYGKLERRTNQKSSAHDGNRTNGLKLVSKRFLLIELPSHNH